MGILNDPKDRRIKELVDESEKLRSLLVRAKGAVADSYEQAHCEWQHLDIKASKLDDRIREWRNDVNALLKGYDDD